MCLLFAFAPHNSAPLTTKPFLKSEINKTPIKPAPLFFFSPVANQVRFEKNNNPELRSWKTDRRGSQSDRWKPKRREDNPISDNAVEGASKPNKDKNTSHGDPPTVHPSLTLAYTAGHC